MLAGVAAAGPLEDGIAAYESSDYKTALKLLRPLAEQGPAMAQVNLGAMYVEGAGVPQDYAEAVKWIRLAAEQGEAEGQLLLGGIVRLRQGRAAGLCRGGEVVPARGRAGPCRRPEQPRHPVRRGPRRRAGGLMSAPICGST